MFTVDNFLSGLQLVFRNAFIEEDNNKIHFKIPFFVEREKQDKMAVIAIIDRVELDEMQKEFTADDYFDNTKLHNKRVLEVALETRGNTRLSPYRLHESKRFDVEGQGYSFDISKASNKYCFALMAHIGQSKKDDFNMSLMRMSMMDGNTVFNLDAFFEKFRLFTININSTHDTKKDVFVKMAESYLFNISYSYDLVFNMLDVSNNKRLMRRRVVRNGQLFPYKRYNQELVKYYYQGIISSEPFTQYLALYHVAEFFFQSISEHEVFTDIEKFITCPSFSPYNKERINDFYKMIKKKIKDQRDDGVWNERTGLLLCLKKYVPDIEKFKSAITAIDPAALNYYAQHKVSFIDDDVIIDFSKQPDKLYESIRDRVYFIRNAIVHSKDSEKSRYEPFKHDKELVKEVALIRALAEEIIINSASSLELK